MAKVITFFLRAPGLTRAAFRDHYERVHVPMGLAANPYFRFKKYVRNHVVAARPGARALPMRELDAFSEFSFHDMSRAVDAQAFMRTPEGKALAEDEPNFVDMTDHPSFSAQEELIAGTPRDLDRGVTAKTVLILKRAEAVQAAEAAERIRRFAQAYARDHAGEMLRLVLDIAEESPAGAPPVDAILTLWPSAQTTAATLAAFRWPGSDFASAVLDIETIEEPPEKLAL